MLQKCKSSALNGCFNFFLSTSNKFVTASRYGTVTLWEGGKPIKTVKHKNQMVVKFIAGKIVLGSTYGKITILDSNLSLIRDVHGNHMVKLWSLSGDDTTVAFGDEGGTGRSIKKFLRFVYQTVIRMFIPKKCMFITGKTVSNG